MRRDPGKQTYIKHTGVSLEERMIQNSKTFIEIGFDIIFNL